MRNAIIYWDKIKRKLSKFQVVLFLDFDGTLAPIARIPSKANLPLKTKRLLLRLVKQVGIEIVLNSGREMEDLQQKVDIKDIYYIGNHGAQFHGPGDLPEQVDPSKYRLGLKIIKKKIQRLLTNYPGAFLEDKKIILTIHFRLLNLDKQKDLLKKIEKAISPYLKANKIWKSTGKKVIEIKPPHNFNKGIAINDLLKILSKKHAKKIIPICIGDDVTDEDAFKVLRKKGIGIHVGRSKTTHASYTLKNTKEVFKFLQLIERKLINDQ